MGIRRVGMVEDGGCDSNGHDRDRGENGDGILRQENGKTMNVNGMCFEGHWAVAGRPIATAFAMTPPKKMAKAGVSISLVLDIAAVFWLVQDTPLIPSVASFGQRTVLYSFESELKH